MAGWNVDRSDTVRLLREQASRVYIQTIAANEREDRILHRKLDAIDLEHRAQFLKMKKWIQDAQANRKKRLMRLRTNVSYASELTDNPNKLSNGCAANDRTLKQDSTMNEDVKKANQNPSSASLQINDNEAAVNEQPTAENKETPRGLSALNHRVKYTESEVAHLKASFAGQRTPPTLRRRKFLPHLNEASAVPIAGNKRKRRMRKKGGRVRAMQTVEEKMTDLNLEASKIRDDKLPKLHLEKSIINATTSTQSS